MKLATVLALLLTAPAMARFSRLRTSQETVTGSDTDSSVESVPVSSVKKIKKTFWAYGAVSSGMKKCFDIDKWCKSDDYEFGAADTDILKCFAAQKTLANSWAYYEAKGTIVLDVPGSRITSAKLDMSHDTATVATAFSESTEFAKIGGFALDWEPAGARPYLNTAKAEADAGSYNLAIADATSITETRARTRLSDSSWFRVSGASITKFQATLSAIVGAGAASYAQSDVDTYITAGADAYANVYYDACVSWYGSWEYCSPYSEQHGAAFGKAFGGAFTLTTFGFDFNIKAAVKYGQIEITFAGADYGASTTGTFCKAKVSAD